MWPVGKVTPVPDKVAVSPDRVIGAEVPEVPTILSTLSVLPIFYTIVRVAVEGTVIVAFAVKGPTNNIL